MRLALGFAGPAFVALLAGASLVMQSALNSQLRSALNSPVRAGLISYVGGTITMLLIALAMRESWSYASDLPRVSWWLLTGGFFGAAYIVAIIVLIPRVGAATVFALIVTGQMLASLVFDQFGVFGITQRSIDLTRVAGALLLIAGVVLIRRP
jgi:transporter family-2 protein